MLTGQPAFTGDTITDVLGGIVRVDPDWNALPSDTPPLLRLLLRQCLQKSRGARLHHIGDARIQMDAALSEAASTVAAKPRRPVVWMAVTALLIVAIAVLGTLAWNRSDADTRGVVRFTMSMPEKTFYPNSPSSPHLAVSPDGRRIAFNALDSSPRIWLRTLDSPEPRLLPGTEGVGPTAAFWSPDSQHIAFFAQGKLKRLDVSGGPPQTLCDAPGSLTGSWNEELMLLPLFGDRKPFPYMPKSNFSYAQARLLPDAKWLRSHNCCSKAVPIPTRRASFMVAARRRWD